MRFLGSICVSVFLLAAGSFPALAQDTPAQRKAAKQAKKWVGPKLTPRQQLELLMQMPPEEREQFLSQLPEARRTQLENLVKLPAEERALRLRRLDLLNSLTPERKAAVTQEIGNIKLMNFVRRRARLHSKEFEQSFTPDEQELIRDTFVKASQ
ncbi:MAG TPA: hypothetical protein VGN17_19925 [Bryobacteraceae bacterium]